MDQGISKLPPIPKDGRRKNRGSPERLSKLQRKIFEALAEWYQNWVSDGKESRAIYFDPIDVICIIGKERIDRTHSLRNSVGRSIINLTKKGYFEFYLKHDDDPLNWHSGEMREDWPEAMSGKLRRSNYRLTDKGIEMILNVVNLQGEEQQQ